MKIQETLGSLNRSLARSLQWLLVSVFLILVIVVLWGGREPLFIRHAGVLV
jgi:hypothetical protein